MVNNANLNRETWILQAPLNKERKGRAKSMKLKIFMKNYWVVFLIVIIAYLAFVYLELKFDEIEIKIIRAAELIISK